MGIQELVLLAVIFIAVGLVFILQPWKTNIDLTSKDETKLSEETGVFKEERSVAEEILAESVEVVKPKKRYRKSKPSTTAKVVDKTEVTKVTSKESKVKK